jgi:autotransporter-associated beta strand protein
MKSITARRCALAACVLLGTTSAQAQILWSSATGSAWLTGTNWTGGVVPGASDIAQFGVNPTAATGVGINGNGNPASSVGALEVLSTRTAAMLVGNSSSTAGSPVTLTFNGTTVNGIANTVLRNASGQSLTLQNTQGTGTQNMNVVLGNATDNIVQIDGTGGIAISSAISGAGPLSLQGTGSGLLTISGANTYTGATTVTSGTLVFARQVSLYNNVTANWTTTNLVVNSGATAAFNVGGTGEFTSANIDTLAALGTPTGGFKSGAILGLDTTNAAATGFTYASAIVDPNSGANIRGLAKLGNGILNLSGTNTYTGGTNVVAGLLNLSNTAAKPASGTITVGANSSLGLAVGGAGFFTSTDLDALFANTLAGVSMNASSGVGIDTTQGNFSYATSQAGARSLTKLGTNTLTLTGTHTYTGSTSINNGGLVLAGGNNTLPSGTAMNFTGTAAALDLGANSQTLSVLTVPDLLIHSSTITGAGGTLTINSSTTDLQWGPGGAIQATPTVTINMTGLSNFIYNASSRTFRVGLKTGVSNNVALGNVSTVTLATNNTLTASILAIGDQGASNSGGTSTLHLGATNTVNANTINMGIGRANAVWDFAGAGSTLTLRGTNGTAPVTTWNLGSVANFGSSNWNSTANFSNGSIDALVTMLNIGNANTTSAGRGGTINGLLSFGSGTLTVTTLNIGLYQSSGSGSIATGATFNGNGTLTLNNAAGTVNATIITLATNTGTTATGTARTTSGTINLLDGTLNATTIQKGAQTGNATAVTTAFNWTTGTIGNITGGNLAITNLPITLLTSASHTFNISGSNTATLNAGSSISGTNFGITKNGTGTLTTAATNTYTGTTTVNAGSLIVTGSLASNGPASILMAAPSDTLVPGVAVLTRPIAAGLNAYAGYGSTVTATSLDPILVAPLQTKAEILMSGTNAAANNLTMQWRTRSAAEASPSNVNAVLSDVIALTDMGSDIFVLQMSYTDAVLTNMGLIENSIALSGELRLGWKNGSNNWVTAVNGNGGGTATFAGVTPWLTYYNTVSSFDDGSDLNAFLGTYGVDPANNVVWAVLNHNSEFAVIPEPSTLALGAIGLLGLGIHRLRRGKTA